MKNKKKIINMSFILPSFIGVIVFYIFPFLDIVKRSFMDDTGKSFVFLDNYKEIFNNKAFLLAGKNTLEFISFCVPILIVLSLLLAIFMKGNRENIIYKTIYLLPMAIPVAALTGIWQIIFDKNGIFNLIRNFGGMNKIDWLNSKYAILILIVTYIWRNFGYTMILWLAGLMTINSEIYEAAAVEGANKRQIFFKITLPILKPFSFTIIVLSILNTFKAFRDIYLLSGDYPDKSIYMIQHILNNWFTNMQFGKVTAAAIIILVIIGFIVLSLLYCFKRQKGEKYKLEKL